VDIVALFYDLDKFAADFEPQFNRLRLEDGKAHRHRQGRMWLSEINYEILSHKNVKKMATREIRRRVATAEIFRITPRSRHAPGPR
jgi:hypothetical protein